MRLTSTVKSYRSRNGCGFIFGDAGDIFVHVSNILENEGTPSDLLVPGEQVEFEVFASRRGLAALRVKRLDPPSLAEKLGTVKRVFEGKGYGFIESGEGDVFFHYADVLFDHIVTGLKVSFLVASVDGRSRAFKVRRNRNG